MNELALFAGAGGGILGGLLLGWRTVCAVEFDEHARNALVARQNDGSLEPFPIWDDVRTFDGKPWHGIIDVVSGGFPCQDISCAGNGAGIRGERSGLWSEMRRIISEVRPRFVLVENSPMLIIRGVGVVLGDLAEMGYNAKWGCIPAQYVGACHGRDRVWILADNMQIGWEPKQQIIPSEYTNLGENFIPHGIPSGRDVQSFWGRSKAEREFFNKSELRRVDDGMAGWVDRLERIGNGQVPAVARKAWHVLCQEIGPKKE